MAVPKQKAVVRAFKQATQGMSKKEKNEFLGYSQGLLQLLEDFECDERDRKFAEDRADRALASQGADLIDAGDIISIGEFINRLGISQEALSKKLRERRIFQMPWVENQIWDDDYFPAFFADAKYDLSSLEAVSKTLRAYNGIRKYRFFTTADPLLENRTPLSALADGDLDRVVKAARAFRQRSPQIKRFRKS